MTFDGSVGRMIMTERIDHVVRRERFEAAHPGVVIRSPRETGDALWAATWDEEHGSTTIKRWELGWLLDTLEARFDPPRKAPVTSAVTLTPKQGPAADASHDCSRDGHDFRDDGKWLSCRYCGYTVKK